MTRYGILFSTVVIFLAGCCCQPQARRMVPTSTVVQVEPQPTNLFAFRDAERQGYLVAATGRGWARGEWDQPVQMCAGEGLHVLRVDPDTGDVLACRLDDRKLVRLSSDGLEVEATTFGH